jgi:hypothetical protein
LDSSRFSSVSLGLNSMMYFTASLLGLLLFLLIVVWSLIEFYLDSRKKKSMKP